MSALLPVSLNQSAKVVPSPKVAFSSSDGPAGGCVRTTRISHSNKRVQDGLLMGWHKQQAEQHCNNHKPFSCWDASFGEEERNWEDKAQRESVQTAEEVAQLLPAKWQSYKLEVGEESKELSRICVMCTALVNKYVQLSSGAEVPKSTAQWREREALKRKIDRIMQLLEESIGESIPMASLQDPDFLSTVWAQIDEEDRAELFQAMSGGGGGGNPSSAAPGSRDGKGGKRKQ
jgi:hypothetical protein